MSNLIRVLETIGADALLRDGMHDDAAGVVATLDTTDSVKAALIAGNIPRLADLAGANRIVCCSLEKHDDDEDEQDVPDHEDEKVHLLNVSVTAC